MVKYMLLSQEGLEVESEDPLVRRLSSMSPADLHSLASNADLPEFTKKADGEPTRFPLAKDTHPASPHTPNLARSPTHVVLVPFVQGNRDAIYGLVEADNKLPHSPLKVESLLKKKGMGRFLPSRSFSRRSTRMPSFVFNSEHSTVIIDSGAGEVFIVNFFDGKTSTSAPQVEVYLANSENNQGQFNRIRRPGIGSRRVAKAMRSGMVTLKKGLKEET